MGKKTNGSFPLVEVDGLYFQKRPVCVEKGKKQIGTVDVPYPTTFEELQEFCEKGVETEIHAVSLYVAAKAVELQAAARRAVTAKKVPVSEWNRLFNSLTAEEHEACRETEDPGLALNILIQKKWELGKESA